MASNGNIKFLNKPNIAANEDPCMFPVKTKDDIYRNQNESKRLSYTEKEPQNWVLSEVICKQNINHINIKTPLFTGMDRTFDTDCRVSLNVEHKFDSKTGAPKNMVLDQTRFKDRYSFQIAWMRLDLTIVEFKDGRFPEFECELEICDSDHIVRHMKDILALRGIVRKFL